MAKRIALLIFGFLFAVGGFLVYRYFTDTGTLGPKGPTVVVATAPREKLPWTYEYRSLDGTLEYVLSAASADSAKGKDGQVIPNQFVLTQPSARYYTSDGRLVTIRSDTGFVALDQTVVAGKPKMNPRGGRLSGNVVLTFGPQDTEGTGGALTADKDSTITVKLSRDLEFDNVQRVLTSPGEINVRSNQIAFDGEDLAIAFNPDEKRLEYFRIEKGNRIVLKDVDVGALSLNDTGTATGPASTRGAGGGTMLVSATGPATIPGTMPGGGPVDAVVHKANLPTSYKLSFGQDVAATLGTSTLTSDRLYVLFMAAANDVEKRTALQTGGAADGAPVVPATASAPATDSALTNRPPTVIEPVPPAKPQDLVITWTGPMEMRPTSKDDIVLSGPKDKALEAVGTVERPVVIHDGDRVVEAGRLWLHAAEKRLELEPGDLQVVKVSDPAHGTVACAGVSYTRETNHLKLIGPGRIEVPQSVLRKKKTVAAGASPGKPLAIIWPKVMDLDLVDAKDAKKAGKSGVTATIRRALITGGATIEDPTFELTSDTLDALVASTGDEANPQALEHLLATGNVAVKSFKNGPKTTQPEGMESQRLELVTAPGPALAGGGKGAPVPSHLLLDGDVTAWSYRAEKDKDKDKSSAATQPKGPAKQTVYAEHVDITLGAKSASAAATEPGDTSLALGDFEATHFEATSGSAVERGIKVQLENYATQLITATAQSLDATPLNKRATLVGSAANPAKVVFADDTITGASIELDQDRNLFHIPGAGDFAFTMPANGRDRKTPTPMAVHWTKGMTFDSVALLATFEGDAAQGQAVARMIPANHVDTGQISADRLDVKLKHIGKAGDTASNADLLASGTGELGLDTIVAAGHVQASGGQAGEDGKAVTQMNMWTEKLTYNDDTKVLTIPGPGSMLLQDDRPEKKPDLARADDPGTGSSRGTTAFRWVRSLAYDQKNDTVEFNGNVQMAHQPNKPIRVPTDDPNKPEMGKRVTLNTDHLVAKLMQGKALAGTTAVANPVNLGAGGNQQLERVTADHGAVLTMDSLQELRAETLVYDSVAHSATATGTDGNPATFSEPEKALVQADEISWDMADNKFTSKHPRGDIQLQPLQ